MFAIDKQKFGAFIAALRKEKGYTQKELAEKLCISDKAVSKWETGASIPDTALLVPLSETLGVNVTELLLCERVDAVEPEQAEAAVKAAIAYPGEDAERVGRHAGRWRAIYPAALCAGAALLILGRTGGYIPDGLLSGALLSLILGAVFGAYFCFFATARLPRCYDEYRVTSLADGPFRMNVGGLFAFNNRNWPHILNVGRAWAAAAMALFPLWCMLLTAVLPRELTENVGALLGFTLGPLLGGLFVPMLVAGKKYE